MDNKSAAVAASKADKDSKINGSYAPPGRGLDQAYWYMHGSRSHNEDQASASELKALRRKVDWRILPIMFCCYTMQFIDKVSLNVLFPPWRLRSQRPTCLPVIQYAAVMGLNKDLKLKGNEFTNVATWFFLHCLADRRGAQRFV